MAEQLNDLIADLVKIHASPSPCVSLEGMSQYYNSAYQNRGLISIAIARHSGDFRNRFSTRLHTYSPAFHPVQWGVPPQRGEARWGEAQERMGTGARSAPVGPPPTSPRWGEAKSPSTLPWITTREVLFKKSPQGYCGEVLAFDP